jgi:hypothetical protein
MTDAFEEQERPDEPDMVEPEYAEVAPGVQGETDPVTARNEDPAAMSEAERNQILTEKYTQH